MDYILQKIFLRQNIRLVIQGVIAAILLVSGTLFYRTGHYHVYYRALSAYALYFLGVVFRKFCSSKELSHKWIHPIIAVISLIVLLIMSHFGTVSLASNSYKDPLFLLIVSVSGWLFVYIASRGLKKVPLLSDFLILCGKHSREIMIFHFLAFRLVNLFRVRIFKLPEFLIASSPVFDPSKGWWAAYLGIGIFLPLLMAVLSYHWIRSVRDTLKRHKLERNRLQNDTDGFSDEEEQRLTDKRRESD